MNTSYNINQISALLDNEKWHWGYTHEYITKYDCLMSSQNFQMIIDTIITLGKVEKHHKYSSPHLIIGNHKYWTHRASIDQTILNREIILPKLEELEDTEILEDIIPLGYSSSFHIRFGDYWRNREIFEIFCGWGWSIDTLMLDIRKYTGIDTNPQNITLFKKNYPYAYNRIYNSTFEDSIRLWVKGNSIILGTFGAASYVTAAGLRDLDKSGKDYLLMFYHEDCCPKEYRRTSYYKYSLEDIHFILPNAQVLPFLGYYVVSNMELHKHEVNRIVEYELSHLDCLFKTSFTDRNLPYNALFHLQMEHIMREGDNLFQRYSIYIEYSKIDIDYCFVIKQYENFICRYKTIKSKIRSCDRETFESIMLSVSDRITLFNESKHKFDLQL